MTGTTQSPPPKKPAVYEPLSWQIAPWRDKSLILLLTGSAGGGKSRLAAEKLHGFCLKYPGAMTLALRKTRQSMVNSTVLVLERKIMAGQSGIKHNQNKNRFEYANGSILAYGGMKDDEQREQIRSIGQDGGLDLCWMEEANRFSETDFNEILGRMRGKAAGWRQVILTTNPDSPAHWIYRRLILKREAAVYKSGAVDNPHNPADYLSVLSRMTGLMARRLVKGEWVQAEGVIWPEFDPTIHIVPRFEIPPAWERIRSVDFGFTNPFVCYDDQTQVLTASGWKLFADLLPTDRVATVRPDGSHCVEYQLPTAYIAQQYDGPMVQCEPGRGGANFCVTPNHRMVLEARRSGDWRFVPAGGMGGDDSIPVGWGPRVEGYSTGSAFAEFVGLWLADGCLTRGGHDKSQYVVRIAQKNYPEDVRRILRSIGARWSEWTNKNGVIDFAISDPGLWGRLYRLAGKVSSAEKRIPRTLLDSDPATLRSLLAGLMLGDGSAERRDANGVITQTRRYCTTSPGLADDVQELACLLGIPTVRRQSTSKGFGGKDQTLYVVAFTVARRAPLRRLPIRRIHYRGVVRCVTVPNGTLIVRRGGRPMVCGNCQWWAIDPDGRMYRYREIYRTQRLVEDHVLGVRDENGNVLQKGIIGLSAGERIRLTVADHDAEDRATMNRHGVPTAPAWKSVKPGIEAVSARLRIAGDGRPRIFFLEDSLVERDPLLPDGAPTCTEEEIPGYVWPEGQDGKPAKEEPVKFNDHGCFVAGTMVQTDAGPRPIESMGVGDCVLTRSGYKTVTAAGMTSHASRVWELEFSDGRRLVGTGSHPVWVEGKGFVSLDSMRYDDTIATCEANASDSMESTSAATPNRLTGRTASTSPRRFTPGNEAFAASMRNCGSRHTAQFPPGMRSTMRTEIRSTTTSTTFSALPKPNTGSGTATIPIRQFWSRSGRTSKRPLPPLPRGIGARKDGLGTHRMHGGPSPIGSRFSVSATSAEAPSPAPPSQDTAGFVPTPANRLGDEPTASMTFPVSAKAAGANSATTSSSPVDSAPVRVLTVRKLPLPAAVYNLTVADAHEYFANGVLVHNCDDMRYATASVDNLGGIRLNFDDADADAVGAWQT